jgi:hypothetical protein
MTEQEAIAWLKGERSSLNYTQPEPMETYHMRIAATDAAMMSQAYTVLKAIKDGLI